MTTAFNIDPADVVIGESPVRGTKERDEYSIEKLLSVSLGHTETPADAMRLLLFTIADLADRGARADDVLTAAIAMLRELRDGPTIAQLEVEPDLPAHLEQAFAELRDMPAPPNPSGAEIVAAATWIDRPWLVPGARVILARPPPDCDFSGEWIVERTGAAHAWLRQGNSYINQPVANLEPAPDPDDTRPMRKK